MKEFRIRAIGHQPLGALQGTFLENFLKRVRSARCATSFGMVWQPSWSECAKRAGRMAVVPGVSEMHQRSKGCGKSEVVVSTAGAR
jgi:hypothetical protein